MAVVIDGFYKKINNQNEAQHYMFKDSDLTATVSGVEDKIDKHLAAYDQHKEEFTRHVSDFGAVKERLSQVDFTKFHFVYDDYLGTNGGVKLVFKEKKEEELP